METSFFSLFERRRRRRSSSLIYQKMRRRSKRRSMLLRHGHKSQRVSGYSLPRPILFLKWINRHIHTRLAIKHQQEPVALAPLPTTARNIVGNGGNLNMNTKCVIIIKWFWFFNNCKWIILVYSFMNKVYLFNKFLLDVSVDKFWLNTFVNDRNLSLRYRKTISLTSSSTHTEENWAFTEGKMVL